MSPKHEMKQKMVKGNAGYVHLSLFCFPPLFSPSGSFKLRHGCYYSTVMSILELSFLHTTMSYITALCTASRQFTAVWHYCPSPDVAFSCGCIQLGQIRAAGRSSCQLTSGAS